MARSTERLPTGVVRRLKGRPYYAYLYARNVLRGRLPASLEADFVRDPHSAFLYARDVLEGRLPDAVHNGLVMYSFGGKDEGWTAKYLESVGK